MSARLLKKAFRSIRFGQMALILLMWITISGHSTLAESLVWILNSDHSVNRYRMAENAFKASWPGKTINIDLGRLTLDQNEFDWRMSRNPPDAIYCIGSKAYVIARQFTTDKPIVLSSAINWEILPAATNDFVVANELPIQTQLTLFRHLFPGVRRIGIFYSPTYREQWIKEAMNIGGGLNVEIISRPINKSGDISGGVHALLNEVDALWLIADPVVLGWADTTRELFAQAHAAGKPIFTYSTAFAELGATLILSPDDETVGRQAAGILLDREAEKPVNTRVHYPAGSEIILNLHRARAYGVELNQNALNTVNRFIESGGE